MSFPSSIPALGNASLRHLTPRALPLVLSALSMMALGLTGCPKPLAQKSGPTAATGKSVLPFAVKGRAPGDGTKVAIIGGDALTVGELEERLNSQSPFVRARYSAADKKKEFVESQVRFEVLARAAVERGYQDKPDVQEAIKKIIVQKLTREVFDNGIKPTDVTDVNMRAYFDSHQGEYQKPEMIRASQIFISKAKGGTLAKAQTVRKKAVVPATLTNRAVFKKLVTEFSDDEEMLKKAGGDLRYMTNEDAAKKLGPQEAKALFELRKINDVTEVIATDDGWRFFKSTGHRKAISRSFEQVRNQIRSVLFREKRTASFNKFIEDQKKALGVQIFDDAISKIRVKSNKPSIVPGPASVGGKMPGVPPSAQFNNPRARTPQQPR